MFGYLHIKISGKFPERLLNILSQNDIRLWNIKKINEVYFAIIKISDFKKLRHFVFVTKTKVKIIKKSGLPFLVYRYRARYGILIGIVVFIAMMIILNIFVWDIKVQGNTTISKQEIVSILEKNGVKTPIVKKNIDVSKLELSLKQENNIIIWTQIKIEGVILLVEIGEGKTPPKIEEIVYPSNIVSDVDGIISDIKVYSGAQMVQKGDVVYKGKLLVSGIVDAKEKESGMIFPSKATIYAITDKHLSITRNYLFNEKQQTGKYYSRYSLQFFNFSVKLYLGNKDKFTDFEKDSYLKPLTIFSYETPFALKQEITREQTQSEFKLSYELAKIICDTQFIERERILLADEDVIKRDVSYIEDENGITCNGDYKISKKIGITQNIMN
ncbi:MAG: sporulation protein YqfD [Clostridia bacterium]